MRELGKTDVLIDLCTQRDYLLPTGARCVANADQILTRFKRLMSWARWGKLPILSSVDVSRPEEARGVHQPACVAGTWGHRKIGYSVMPNRIVLESDNGVCVPLDLLRHYQQAIFTKRHRDPLTNPKLDRLVTEMPARRFLVFGVALDSCICPLVLGLLLRGRAVVLVGDACGFWDESDADFSLRQLDAKGCRITTVDAIIRESGTLQRMRATARRRNNRSVA